MDEDKWKQLEDFYSAQIYIECTFGSEEPLLRCMQYLVHYGGLCPNEPVDLINIRGLVDQIIAVNEGWV